MGFLDDLFPITSKKDSPFERTGSNRHDERKAEIERLNSSARENVQIGKRIYNEVKQEAKNAQSRAEKAIKSYNSFCSSTAQKLGEQINSLNGRYGDSSIDSRVEPHVGTIFDVKIPTENFMPNISDGDSIIDYIIDEYRYEKAQEQCARAKEYKEEMIALREEVRSKRAQLLAMVQCVEQEVEQGKVLVDKVEKIIARLQSSMQKNSLSSQEAQYLKTIRDIAKLICAHLSTDFLNRDGTINSEFKKQSSALQELSNSIPATPTVDEHTLLTLLQTIDSLHIEV